MPKEEGPPILMPGSSQWMLAIHDDGREIF